MYHTNELPYIDLLKEIIDYGALSDDRTGVGTKSLFGKSFDFDIRNHLPLFTTRKIFFRGAVEELLWMIRGETDAKKLQEKGIHIWDGNTTKDFIEERGLDIDKGQIGKLYGFQMRNWGGDWDKHLQGIRTGIDQLQNIFNEIRNFPHSRRMVMSYWNVSDLDKGVLAPCHYSVQFRINQEKDELDCLVNQRSCDMMCGVPFNVVFYSLMCMLVAKATGYKPGNLRWNGGDCHIYLMHLEKVKEQVKREPKTFPQVTIPDVKSIEDIENLSFEDFELHNYNHDEPIKYKMAV